MATHDVVAIYADGTTETFTQAVIVRPKYVCGISAVDYVSRVIESGVVTEIDDGTGVVTTRRVGPHDLREVSFIRECT